MTVIGGTSLRSARPQLHGPHNLAANPCTPHPARTTLSCAPPATLCRGGFDCHRRRARGDTTVHRVGTAIGREASPRRVVDQDPENAGESNGREPWLVERPLRSGDGWGQGLVQVVTGSDPWRRAGRNQGLRVVSRAARPGTRHRLTLLPVRAVGHDRAAQVDVIAAPGLRRRWLRREGKHQHGEQTRSWWEERPGLWQALHFASGGHDPRGTRGQSGTNLSAPAQPRKHVSGVFVVALLKSGRAVVKCWEQVLLRSADHANP